MKDTLGYIGIFDLFPNSKERLLICSKKGTDDVTTVGGNSVLSAGRAEKWEPHRAGTEAEGTGVGTGGWAGKTERNGLCEM